MNNINTWAQGRFIDNSRYRNWSQAEKDQAEGAEKLLVRPAPESNAICKCFTPTDAKWIASRLNLAADLEQLSYDYATGKTDGEELVEYVQKILRDGQLNKVLSTSKGDSNTSTHDLKHDGVLYQVLSDLRNIT
ncbi:MAG: hypothetical protein WC139_07105 [Candidatus Kapaibacterium sp.]